MKLNEAVGVHTLDHSRIDEDMLSEAFIADTIRPALDSLFTKKVKKESKLKQKYNNAMREYEQQLTAMGVDGKQVRDIAERKARGMNPESLKESTIKKQIGEMIEEIQEKGFRSLTVPIITVAVIVFINSMMMLMFVSLAGPVIGASMTAILVGPLTEEIGRFINVKRRDGGRFNIIFNITEYSIYMFQAALAGVPLAAMAAIRILPVIMHTLWTVILRKNMQAGASAPPLKTITAHALFNSIPFIGVVTTMVMVSGKNPDANETTRMVVFGIDEETNRSAFRNEIVARNPDVIFVQNGVDTSGLLMTGVLDVEVTMFTDFSEVKSAYQAFDKYQKIVTVMDNRLLNYKTKEGKWLMNKIGIEIYKEKQGSITA